MTVDKAVSLLSQMFLIQFSKEEHEALAMAIDALNADRKTENSSEKPNNCEPQKFCFTCGYALKSAICNTCEGYSNWWSLEDEPQNCENRECKNWDTINDHCMFIEQCHYEPKDKSKLCRECEEYAGDGMYCASNYLVYDFSTSRENCKTKRSE